MHLCSLSNTMIECESCPHSVPHTYSTACLDVYECPVRIYGMGGCKVLSERSRRFDELLDRYENRTHQKETLIKEPFFFSRNDKH